MARYRKILVAVDGSESSKNAFRQACSIAKRDKSWLTVITAVPPYQDQFQTLNIREKVSNALREEGVKILSEINIIAVEEDVFIKPLLEEGSPVDTILDMAEENNFDLIVMGRQGRSRLEKSLVGSVASHVIGHSQKDILVIPDSSSVKWGSLLITTDGSKYCSASTQKAIELAGSYGSSLMALSVVDVTEEFQAQAPDAVEDLIAHAKKYVDEIKKNAEAHGIRTETFVREGDSYKVITDMSKKCSTDIIIMGSHSRTGVKRLFMGSVTGKVIGYAACPVLIVKV